jgi:hypothetical protein
VGSGSRLRKHEFQKREIITCSIQAAAINPSILSTTTAHDGLCGPACCAEAGCCKVIKTKGDSDKKKEKVVELVSSLLFLSS